MQQEAGVLMNILPFYKQNINNKSSAVARRALWIERPMDVHFAPTVAEWRPQERQGVLDYK